MKIEEVMYIICNLFRGLKEKSNLQLLLENILITKTLCADIFKAPKHEIQLKKQETAFESRQSSLKRRKQCNPDVLRE